MPRPRVSWQVVVAGGEEMEEAEVAQNLELLADFVADVAVGGMKRGEVGFESVGVGESESLFVKRAEEVEDVERPAAHFGAQVRERANLGELFSR